jgi:ABC-type amino acid transport substrate-binding protein
MVAGSVVNAAEEGIVIRKGDTSMLNAVKTTFNQLKADGTYHKIIVQWGLTSGEITMIDRRSTFV